MLLSGRTASGQQLVSAPLAAAAVRSVHVRKVRVVAAPAHRVKLIKLERTLVEMVRAICPPKGKATPKDGLIMVDTIIP